jgi:aminoglycoside N3'-acetyltransferase
VDYRDDDFAALGAQFERRTCAVSRGPFGAADALLYPARAAADHAAEWMRRERRETERVFPGRATPSQELAAFL